MTDLSFYQEPLHLKVDATSGYGLRQVTDDGRPVANVDGLALKQKPGEPNVVTVTLGNIEVAGSRRMVPSEQTSIEFDSETGEILTKAAEQFRETLADVGGGSVSVNGEEVLQVDGR